MLRDQHMNGVYRSLGILIFCIGLIMISSGAIVDDVVWSRNKEWVVANGADTCTISLQIENATNVTMDGYPVQFSIENGIYGSFNPSTSYTVDGKASTTFTTKTKSGIANFTGAVSFKVNDSDPNEIPQTRTWSTIIKIDHDTPLQMTSYTVPPEATVGSQIPLTLKYSDQWGNPIDNRRYPEELYFYVSSPDGSAIFVNATPPGPAADIQNDNSGNFTAWLRVSSIPGTNAIQVHPFDGLLSDRYFFIQSTANAPPVAIEQFFDPEGYLGNPPKQYADGVSIFQIIYTVKDQYGNGVINSPIHISTTIPGEDTIVYTNSLGQAMLTYGPKTSIGRITITAQSGVNASATCSKEVLFISQEAVDMQFTANPDNIPSRDVEDWIPGELRAKVIDENGNPVEGEVVTFSMGTPVYLETYNVTMEPNLSAETAISNAEGYATVDFLPGAFTATWADLLYDPTASGSVPVTAHWENVTRNLSATHTLTVYWKNYPYLSLETSVHPQTVNVTDSVDVMIKLKGDGWALQPNPIDVMLTIDRSGSMLYDNPDRMHSVREAAMVFVDSLSPIRDRIGLVTFGRNGYISRPGYNSGLSTSYINNIYVYPRTYNGYATYDKNITFDFNSVKTELDLIVPDHGTPMREALRLSIEKMIEVNRQKAVKAVVILSDGDYNWYGDPLARNSGRGTTSNPTDYVDLTSYWYSYSGLNATNQNMSAYAKNNEIKIYTIGFANTLSSGGRDTLRYLAESTGGKYYPASATDIADVYTAIAGELKTEAGVNTEVDLNFETIEVNYDVVTQNETYKVFEYIPENPSSTHVYHYNESATFRDEWIDQSDQWNDPVNPFHLEFDVGTIKLGQIWEAHYTLQVLTDGNINIFGPGSTITFNNGEATLLLPKTYITGVPGMVTSGVNTSVLNITNTTSGSDSQGGVEYMVWTWERFYSGAFNVTELYYISNDGGMQWILIGSAELTPEEANQPGEFRYPISLLPPGEITFRVVANALDAPGPVIPPTPTTTPTPTPPPGIFHITIR